MNYKKQLVLGSAKLAVINSLSKYPLFKHFKIGKTTQNLDERFQENYKDIYEGIELLYDAGSDGALIDWLEKEVIDFCLNVYGAEVCDNEQIGGGPNCADNADENNAAKLYLVYENN